MDVAVVEELGAPVNAITPYEKLAAAIIRSGVAGAIKPIQEPSRHQLLMMPSRRRFQVVTKYNAAMRDRNEDRAAVQAWCEESPALIPVVTRLRKEFSQLYAQGKEIPLLPEYYEGEPEIPEDNDDESAAV